MNRPKLSLLGALLSALTCATVASAQTYNISTYSGNGQLICPLCTLGSTQSTLLQQYDPLVAQVTDQNGNPVPGVAVAWNLVNGLATLGAATPTDNNGLSTLQLFNNNFSFGSLLQAIGLPVNVVTATAGNSTATFTEQVALVPLGNSNQNSSPVQVIYNNGATSPIPGGTIAGNAGGQGTPTIQVSVRSPSNGQVVPNVSVRLVPSPNPSFPNPPVVSCVTGPGADPGTVLTDSTGNATCTPVFGGAAGTGQFLVVVGGVAASTQGQFNNGPAGYNVSGATTMIVAPGVPAGITAQSNTNNQSANPGQPIPNALVATVVDGSGNPLSGQQVAWTVSPAGLATLSNTTTTSDASGHVTTNVTLAANAAGQIKVSVALVGSPQTSATFTVTANVILTGLTKVSGDGQTAVVGSNFAQPLTVQVTAGTGLPVANLAVQFAISGPGTLAASTVNTNATGVAQVTVQAGATTGTVTVTATVGSFSQTFTLNVVPTGPTITAGSFANAADGQKGSLSPCSLATASGAGIAPSIQGTVAASYVGAFPFTLAGDTVSVGGSPAPILSVSNTNGAQTVTFQVPCGVTPGTVAVTVNANGSSSTASVPVLPASPGIYQTMMSDGVVRAVIERPDGSFVSLQNPARRGEIVVAYATGLGPTSPSVGTDSVPLPGSTATVLGQVIVGFNGGGVTPISAALSPDAIGVYQISFLIPASSTPGNNVTFSLGLLPQGSGSVNYSNLSFIPVQ